MLKIISEPVHIC